jgi:uncharacterized protein YecE (DUF72 family)
MTLTVNIWAARTRLAYEFRSMGDSQNRAGPARLLTMSPADILIGTSGYSYPGSPPKGWSGVFYPETKHKGFDEIKYYAEIFNAVEINSTFYRIPSAAVTKVWAAKTPPDFTFALKLWQKFTHPMKIIGAGCRLVNGDQWRTLSPASNFSLASASSDLVALGASCSSPASGS